ncbi:IS3 family transposase [Kribbella swartbergensis]
MRGRSSLSEDQRFLLRRRRHRELLGHLKEELFHHTTYTSTDAFITALADYIHWYNNHRTSTRLEGLSPVQYRTQTLAA